jgi:predicted  nucleic acid-binding Zn-ribbon protein
MDKLYEYRFQEINNNTAKLSKQMSCKLNHCISVYDNKLDNTFTTLQQGMQNINNQINILNNNQKEIFIEIQKLKNNAGNDFGQQIDTLTKQQEVTNEKLVALNENVTELDDKIDVSVSDLYQEINQKIDGLEEKLNEKIDHVTYNFKKIDNKIDGLEDELHDKIDDVTYEIKQIKDKIIELEEKLNEKIDGLEEKLNEKIDELEEKLDEKNKNLENISNQNIDTTCLITDKVEMCVSVINKINGKIKKLENVSNQNIDTSIITDKLEICVNAIKKINEKIYEMELENISNPNIDTSIITDKLEICMNAIKKINVYQFPISTFNQGLLQHLHKEKDYYDDLNTKLGTSIIMLNDPHEFSFINQFYNLKVLVINNWALFNYGKFDIMALMQHPQANEADNFTKMRNRYGEMNNKTLETFIIHTAYDFKTGNNPYDPATATRKEPLMLEYLCMQFKSFPSLKIVKLYYLDLPENIEDILINNLKLMTRPIKELHIITNNELKSSKLKTYCNNNNIIFVVPKLNDFIVKNPQSISDFGMSFYWDVVRPLKKQLMDEDDSYMRRNKGYN